MENQCLMPCSLVLITNECFYCRASNDITTHQSLHNFGILACPEHKSLAIRDNKAYLHANKIVLLRDLNEYPEMKAFQEVLGDAVQVLRSNGDVDEDWTIATRMTDDWPRFSKTRGEWAITMVKNEDSLVDSVYKSIRLSTFFDPKLKYHTMGNFASIVDKLTALLDGGIYKNYFNAQQGTRPVEYVVPRPSYIVDMELHDGRIGHVVMPELRAKGA